MSKTPLSIHVVELTPNGLVPFDPPLIWHHTVPRQGEYLNFNGAIYTVMNVAYVVYSDRTTIVDRSEIEIKKL